MREGQGRGGGGRGGGRGARDVDRAKGQRRTLFRRRKMCKFCTEKIDYINYKDVRLLSSFLSERGKITPRRISGVCSPHQRRLAEAIKQARNIALVPFATHI